MTSVAPAVARAGVPHGAMESGWLPDLVYTGEKFESGLAFFADAQGRITRFSREPADLAAARRLAGQAALPGLVNAHSQTWRRAARGRDEMRGAGGSAAALRVAAALGGEDIFDAARMVFLEMLLAGVTCVGEFHVLHGPPAVGAWPEPAFTSREVLRAAHDVGIRIALIRVLALRPEGELAGAAPRLVAASVDAFVRETETLRVAAEKEFPADEAWLAAGVDSLVAVPLEPLKTLASYARAQRMRFHVRVAATAEEAAAVAAEHGRAPLALLAEHGIVDKRFTAIDVAAASAEEIKLLGAARGMACLCPSAAEAAGRALPPAEALLAANAGVALGSAGNAQVDLLREARLLERLRRMTTGRRPALGDDPATAAFHAATVAGARSLGATTGALEVGRPADFFTVNLFEPSLAGADPASLLAHVVFALERRAIRDVWIGARQRIAGGRHANQGPIVGRFVELQKRLWGA